MNYRSLPELTTSIGDANLLYGHYHDMVSAGRYMDALRAWYTYERYMKRYYAERGMAFKTPRRDRSLASVVIEETVIATARVGPWAWGLNEALSQLGVW